MEQDWFFHLMTFNVQVLFNPGELLGDINEGAEIERRAEEVCEALLTLPADERPHVICLNEVFYGPAADIFFEKLGGEGKPWPHVVWQTSVSGGRVVIGAVAGGALAGFVAGAPVAGAVLGGVLGGPVFSDLGGNSGLMILSRLPLEKIPDFASGNEPDGLDSHDIDDYTVITGEYSASVDSDANASKGFLMVRAKHPRFGSLNVLTTHMQASYEDEDPDDRHYGGPDCKLYADVRREQIAQIISSLSYRLDQDGGNSVFVTGDMNVRGELDERTFVDENGATISEYRSVFHAVPAAPYGWPNFERDFIESWNAHRGPPEGVIARPGLIDDGITNRNFDTERGQRLDYILAPRYFPTDIAAQRMLIRYDNLSDHKSLEAWFSYALDHGTPASADVLADHGFAAVDGISRADIYHPAPWLPDPSTHGRGRLYPDHWDWVIADFGEVEDCVAAIKATNAEVDAEQYCARPGRVAGTYAISAYEGSGTDDYLVGTKGELVPCFNLSQIWDPARTQNATATEGILSQGIGSTRRAKLGPAISQVHQLSQPVYIRTFLQGEKPYLLLVQHFTGTTCETALVAPHWRAEPTAWPKPLGAGGLPNAGHERWYQLGTRRHAMEKPYPCRVRIGNPNGHRLNIALFDGCGAAEPRLEQGAPIKIELQDTEILINFTCSGMAEDVRMRLDWLDAAVAMTDVTVTFEPQVSVFANKEAVKAILCKCLDETGMGAFGSDEILLRVYVDDIDQPVHEMKWRDVDTGKSLPGSGCPKFQRFLQEPVVFHQRMRFTVTETGDVDGRDRGSFTVKALKDDEDDVVFASNSDVGSAGKYRLTGTVCRDPVRTG